MKALDGGDSRRRVKHDSGYYCHGCALKRQDLRESKKLALRDAIVVVAVVAVCMAILLFFLFMYDWASHRGI